MKRSGILNTYWSGLFAAFLLLTSNLAAAERAPEPARIALVIGNARYSGSVPELANPVNDAHDVAQHLKEAGWQVLLSENATRKDFSRRLAEFRDQLKASPDASALFFFAGHGLQIDGKNYLLPVAEDFETPDDVRDSALVVDRINDLFAETKARQTVIILDACRDNPFAKKSRSIGGSRGLSVVPVNEAAEEGAAVIFSTAPNDTAADGEGRNGVFTASLLKFMDGPEDLQVMFKAVREDVKKSTAGNQTPSIIISGSLGGFHLGIFDSKAASASNANSATPGALRLAELQGLRAGLDKQLSTLKPQKSLWSAIGGTSWTAGGLGVATALSGLGWGYLARSSYDVATTAEAATAARGQAELANVVWQAGVFVAAGFLTTGLLSTLIAPDTAKVEKDLKTIDSQINALGLTK